MLGHMELKSTELLKVLQRAHEKEPHGDEVAVASSVAARRGRHEEEHDEFGTAQPHLPADHPDAGASRPRDQDR